MIKAYDGQVVHNAMIDAIVAQELSRQHTAREAEMQREIDALRMELDLRKRKDAHIYTRFITAAERDYPAPREGTVIGKALWAVVGWLVLGAHWLVDVFEGDA